jgi:murein DD-endopeptidase MepM/ murein hydrolase activator NlpD
MIASWSKAGLVGANLSLWLFAGLAAFAFTERACAMPLGSSVNHFSVTNFVYPVMGPRASSNFGIRKHPITKKPRKHHDGIDLAAPIGAIIRSIASGHVVFADRYGGYGNLIVIKHADGLTSHYGHCHETSVQVGQKVMAGDIIGTVGTTGHSTGPHLHFEIRRNGAAQNPERFLPGLAVPAQG